MSKILEGNIIKKAHSKTKFTEEMLNELDMCTPEFNKNAHHYFMTTFGYIKHPSKGQMLYEPFKYQLDLIENFHNYRFNINMLGRQMGKALWEETPILTSVGWTTMANLKVGDYVLDENGNHTQVIYKTEKQLNRECYEVKFMHGDSIIADAEHEWSVVVAEDEELITLTTKELLSEYKNNVYIKNNIKNGANDNFYIESIKETKSVPVYCITVDNPSHLFLAGKTLIPTHNCTSGGTTITLRNKTTNEIITMNIGDFHDMIKNRM